MKAIGIIGTGVMGSAIAEGVRRANRDSRILLFDALPEKAEELARRVEGEALPDPGELISRMHNLKGPVVLAVKPRQFASLSETVGALCRESRCISIAAGTGINTLQELFPGAHVIRFMPNVAARIGESVVAIAAADGCPEEFLEDAKRVAESIGLPVPLDENLFSAFTGLSGSGIAYVFSFIHALSLGGTEMGIPYASSLEIALKTITGAVGLLQQDKGNPAELVTRVTSAGGTTIRGIAALEEGAFTATVMSAVREAARKAELMEKGNN